MTMNTRRVAMAGLAAGVLFAVGPASAQQFTMKLSQPTINDVTYEYFKRMKAGIEQHSGGKIKVEIYPTNQLGQLPAVVEGVALGTIEAAASANGFWVSLEPRFAVLDAPGLFDTLEHGFKIMNDPAIRARMATWGADKGIEVLAPSLYSPLMLLSHKAVRTVADLNGQKIRTQGGAPIQVDPLKKLGVIPVSLPLGEALPAMQNKTIDGMVGAAAPYVAFKYYDIAKPMTYLPSTMFAAPVVVNRGWLKSLGPELEKIVREESRKAEVVFGQWDIDDIKAKEEIWKKNGGEVITMSPEESKKYVDLVAPVAASLLSGAKVKEDYEAFLAAGKK
jgi:TRAP-type C4-dicarboxylate transport system substrate-binding protein